MITKLNNFTHKSFVGYTNPNDLLFREKNILFGYNGKGKSSLAIGIKEEFLKQPDKKLENYRIFDRDYISNSLLLENSEGKIKGIEAVFGKGSVDIENKIKGLQKQIVSIEEIEKLESIIDKLQKGIRKEIDSIHDRRKGEANIQKKPKEESVDKVINLYKKDFSDAKKIEADEDKLIKINGDNSIEKQITQYENLTPLSFSKIPINFVEEMKLIFKEKFGEDISIPEYEVVQWIESGLKIHQEDDSCKFCDGKLDYLDVKLKINQYKDNIRHKATEELKQFKEQLQGLLNSIELFEKESKTYITNVSGGIEEYFKEIISKKNEVDNLIKSSQSKIEKIEDEQNFDFDKLAEISNAISEASTKINQIKNDQLIELRKKQNNLTSLVKGAIGLEISKSSSIKDKLKEVKVKNEELKEKREHNGLKQQEIQILKQQKSLTKDFADFVSQILNDINISLKVSLDTDNRNYIIKSSSEDVVLTIKDISEGEKNLLALLFFYYELFADNKQQQIKAEIELIIVDDPISSMDDSNKFYILELVKNLLELSAQQVFVLTHSWEDYCNLSYGRNAWNNNSHFATFQISKTNGKSELAKLKNVEKPYKYLFKEIFEFSQKREDELKTECQIYHYPNVMRRVFEEWYSFKIGKDLNLTNSQQERLTNDLKITEIKEKTSLGLLRKVCNILSHSINGSKNPQEIHQAAKYLMKMVEKNDPLHFHNMKQ
jgi:wobble nucleotide-excising tRNase